MEYIQLDVVDRTAVVTISRPEARNALPMAGWQQMHDVLDRVARDKDVRAVILTGTDVAFAAGDDIKEVADLVDQASGDGRSLMDIREITLLIQQVSVDIVQMPKPVIAAVNGWALGAGFELALICDFIYAAESARFGFPESGIGLTITGGITKSGPFQMPIGMLRELAYTGRTVNAIEAREIGFVNRIVPDESLLDEALETAKQIAGRAPIAVGFIKKSFLQGMEGSFSAALAFETELVLASLATKDAQEGAFAFREKRPPAYENR